MKACGLVVEYNPLHNGHVYHIQEAKKLSQADCMIAVMSGSFLQRGEPAIIDKFHRTKAALLAGVDIVLELPYLYAVQSSKLFAKGSVHTLNEIGVAAICFGSESGTISNFITSYYNFKEKEKIYNEKIKKYLDQGLSFPKASEHAKQNVGLSTDDMDLSKPNNILGFSYVRTILDDHLPINPLTIKRKNNEFHDKTITSSIASATSIRKQLLINHCVPPEVVYTIPDKTIEQLLDYKQKAGMWHSLESYFQIIQYRVLTMTPQELASIHGVDEGLEYRLKHTAKHATSFEQWMNEMKSKRYTWTRLQRMFIHILTNTKKDDIKFIIDNKSVPSIRILGFSKVGRAYLNQYKKDFAVPIITSLSRNPSPLLAIEEKASDAYYSIVPSRKKIQLQKQEIEPPLQVDG